MTRFLLGTVVLCGACLLFGEALLVFAGQMLTCEESTDGHDRLLILGGDRRFDAAADMFAKGEVREILLWQDSDSNLVRFGIVPTGSDVARRELSQREVPEAAVQTIERNSERTAWQDLSAWLEIHDSARVRVVTSQFDGRRVRFMIDQALPASQVGRVRVMGLTDRRYDEANWWRSSVGVKAFLGSSLDLIHAWSVSGGDPPNYQRWDPIEYERQLELSVRGNL